ncbi:unnamed protein product, partial [Allacma fusca]
MVVGSKPKIGM